MALSPKKRDEARKLYLAGNAIPEIVKRTGVSERAIYAWIDKYAWRKELAEVEQKAADSSRATLIERRAEVNQAYFGVANKALKTVSELLDQVDQAEGIRDKAAVAHTLAGALLRLLNVHNGAMGVGTSQPQPVPLSPEPEPTEAELVAEYERMSGKRIDDDDMVGPRAESCSGTGESRPPQVAQAQGT
jgi:transposase-like protein